MKTHNKPEGEAYQEHILVVDDKGNDTTGGVDVVKQRLESRGYAVRLETDPNLLLAFSQEEMCKYPVFILDYDMPIHADKLIGTIRKQSLLAYIIVYTGFPSLDRYETVRAITLKGADYWTRKGDIDMEEEMFQRIEYAFRRLKDMYAPLHLQQEEDIVHLEHEEEKA